jgi:hypothetical protein
LTYRRWSGYSGLSYKLQLYFVSHKEWLNAGFPHEVLSLEGDMETVRVKVPPPPGGTNYLFRLQVEQVP